MERRLNKKINDYVHTFKTDITEKIKSMANENNDSGFDVVGLTNYVYEYGRFEFQKDDFVKRKRVKNTVPNYERCCAKRASGEQCTRRRKDEHQYCGTHSKGTPHGTISDAETISQTTTKVEVTTIDIKGIMYYIDNVANVYDPEDILANIVNPKIIAKYVKDGEVYNIPELFNN
jgi:hypothetical protein